MLADQTQPNPKNKPAGFSLVELLVVIAIMAVVAGMAFPFMKSMQSSTAESSAEMAVVGAVSAARQRSTKPSSEYEPISGGGQDFAGVAALFTNTGEIRIVKHDPAWIKNNPDDIFGYRDIPNEDFIEFPVGMRVLGIYRNGGNATGGLRLITPPFAIRFNRHGELTTGAPSNTEYNVYYDHDGDGVLEADYGTASNRLDLTNYDPDDPDNQETITINTAAGPINKFELPFERIETVMGVVILPDTYLDSEYYVGSGSNNALPDNIAQDILGGDLFNPSDTDPSIPDRTRQREGLKVLFFNRMTGAPIEFRAPVQ